MSRRPSRLGRVGVVVSVIGLLGLALGFGIAQSTQRVTQTKAGVVKGKVRYMSPEQCQAPPVDHRSDLF